MRVWQHLKKRRSSLSDEEMTISLMTDKAGKKGEMAGLPGLSDIVPHWPQYFGAKRELNF